MIQHGNQGDEPLAVGDAVQVQAPPEEENDDDDDDSGDAEDAEEEPIPSITGPDDPQRMRLTREETQWALDIKYVIENLPEVDNLSDFWYAQLAIICKHNVEDAIQKAMGLQSFRQEYGILESLKDGIRHISDVCRLLPQFVLAVSFIHQDGGYVGVVDWNKANFHKLSSKQDVQSFFAGMYYLQHSMLPDLASIRNGFQMLAECQDVQWAKKKDFKLVIKLAFEMLNFYPCKVVIKNYHSGLVMNMLLSLLRRALPEGIDVHAGFCWDCRLDSLYLVPTVEAATERMLRQLNECLARRFENAKEFSLSK
jgi:hypothetical protein